MIHIDRLYDRRKPCINVDSIFRCLLRLAGMYNVLIVDEEEHLLWALEKNLFPDRDDIQIHTASNGEDGFEGLKRGNVDLLVSDIKMPGKIDGFQLILRAKEIAPDARVVIMTAFGTNRIQNFADRIGVTHYIEKPFNVTELRDVILEILDEREGFQGVLSDLELTDIIQMLCLAKRTALLHLKNKSHRGKIVFENGEVTHAEFDGTVGDEAVYRMLALRQGDIFMQSDFQNDQNSIVGSWQDLLFEGVKRADEERAFGEDDEDDEDDTDLGMGISEDDVASVVSIAPESGVEDDDDAISFFSDAELEEIERASVAIVDDQTTKASVEAPKSEDGPTPTIIAEYGDIDNEEVRTALGAPDRERETVAHDAVVDELLEPSETIVPDAVEASGKREFQSNPTTSPRAKPVLTTVEPEPSVETEFRGPFTSRATSEEGSGLMRVLTNNKFREQLDLFARDCPGLRITGVVDNGRAMALDFVELQPSGYDADAIAVFFADVITAANRTVGAVQPGANFTELQLAFVDEFVILRRLAGTPYIHIAVMDRNTSLGVALVMMRRFQKSLVAKKG